MRETTVRVAGYLLFVGERHSFTLRQLRDLLPPVAARCRRKVRAPAVLLVGQVSALVTVPESCYPGSLGQLLEGFTCTFLDSLRPRRPESCRDWPSAVKRWRNWPRDTLWDADAVFDVGSAEIFGVVRLFSSNFAGDVTRAIVCQREPNLTPLAAPSQPSWPRVLCLGGDEDVREEPTGPEAVGTT